ncbi:MAG: SRPBCC family protein [Actinomycetota bacterium]
MATIRHHTHVDRSPDDVWKVVSDAGSISAWFPGIETSSAEGSERRCSVAGGIELVEEIVTVDDELRRFQYRITEGMPVEFHLGTVDVLPDGDGALVIYSTDVLPDQTKEFMNSALADGLAGLKSHLEG